MNYPSKKSMWMIIAAFIVVTGSLLLGQYWGAVWEGQGQVKPVASNIPANNGSSPTILADGDWQKVLVGTGVSSSPNGGSLSDGTTTVESAPQSETAKLGEALVSGYMQLKQSGEDVSTDTIDALVSNTLNDPSIVPAAKVYAFSDLNIGKDDSIAAALTYGTAINALFKNNVAVGNEATYARDAEERSDPTIAAKIDPIITTYQNILNSLLTLSVPPSAAKVHLDLVNAMSERLMVAKLLRSVNSDPAAGLEGAGQYMKGLQDLSSAFLELKQYFSAIQASEGSTTTSSQIPGSNQ